MFLNYQDIAKNYTPNNLTREFKATYEEGKLFSTENSLPFEERSATGDLIGYSWNYGESLNLEFQIDGEIKVEGDAIISHTSGVTPTVNTRGTLGQKFYNMCDEVSYTLIARPAPYYVWKRDETFTFPENGTQFVYVSAEDYLKGKTVEFNLYNFRNEVIYTKSFQGKNVIRVPISKKLSKEIVRGIYRCSLTVSDNETSTTIFAPQDCILLVK